MAAALFFERIEAMRHFYHLTHDDRIKIEALLKDTHRKKLQIISVAIFLQYIEN